MPSVRLFVYGSLKRAGRHHDQLQNAEFLGEVQTLPGYALEPLGEYQALVAAPGSASRVTGELFELSQPATTPNMANTAKSRLTALDAFEGDDYVRGEVRLDHGKCGLALAYFRKAR